jgi:DNA replication protein DnaC
VTRPAPATVEGTQLAASLKTLNLSGMLGTLDARLAQAAAGDLGFVDFLQALCLDEITRRDSARLARRARAARFASPGQTLEAFDMSADPAIPAARIRDLAALSWLDAGRHLIITGPVGAGKTHIATALAHQAIRAGRTARFATASRLLADLSGGRADGTWNTRLAAYQKPGLLVLDDWAMREMTGAQADDLYELVSHRDTAPQARSIIFTTNRAPEDWYPLFPNPVVAESLLDRVVNNAERLHIGAASYRARQRPQTAPATTHRGGSKP